ncbi:MAG: glycoside hydrolase family 127 protein [Caldilinea sp.]
MPTNSAHYHIAAVPFTAVHIDDAFWSPRIETNRVVTVPYDFRKCEETGRIANFARAAGLEEGAHEGIFFNDSDVFKVIEGAAYSLMLSPDPELEAYLDALIDLIAAAQEDDGYLYTARTIAERNGAPNALLPDREGLARWSNLRVNHELYNVGHLYEGAVAHYQATGKRTLLDVALKNADLIDSVFGPGKRRDVPGHQEIEIGLVKLYLVTGEARYLALARFFLDERGQPDGHELYGAYAQDHLPVTVQSEAVGHAVRAGYMYAAMADVAALTGEQSYIDAMNRIWTDVVSTKLYLTGGIGARHEGEAFGDAYELPTATAYNETCAAIANIYWNQRLFQLHGHAKYIDVLERSLYNGFLSGVDLSGDRFFYVNPLSFDGQFCFNRDNSRERMPWFNCSCCPTNVVRLFPALGGYIYAHATARLYVNLFVSSRAKLMIGDTSVAVTQETHYPWSGAVRMAIEPAAPSRFTLYVRIPGWAQNLPVPSDLYRYVGTRSEESIRLAVNGVEAEMRIEDGYAMIDREWQQGDVVDLELPMPVRRVEPHPAVTAIQGLVAVERGPLVYCLEGVDNDGVALGRLLSDDAAFTLERPLGPSQDITMLRAHSTGSQLLFVPYYVWGHRGLGEMAVWMKRSDGK